MTRPLIGVTGPDRGGGAAWIFTRRAIRAAGGEAVRLRPSRRKIELSDLSGLVLGGGADLQPALESDTLPDATTDVARDGAPAGASVHPIADQAAATRADAQADSGAETNVDTAASANVPANPEAEEIAEAVVDLRRRKATRTLVNPRDRDDMEHEILAHALERRLPVLGICRGMQLINVHLGGTLHDEIRGFYTEVAYMKTVLPRKIVRLLPDSRLARALDAEICRVNALHHQAVDQLGNEVRAVAWESTEIVQAIESDAHPFVIGVQWHPEYLPQVRRQRALFQKLVAAARGSR